MDSWPACTASLRRNGKVHCTSATCVWIKCTSCDVTIDSNTKAYNRAGIIWGNPDGYLKTTEGLDGREANERA